MRIALDARPDLGDIERNARALVDRLELALPPGELAVFGRPPQVSVVEPPHVKRRPPRLTPALRNLRRLGQDQVTLARFVRRHGAQVFHSTGCLIPARLDVPAIVTVHDLWSLNHPEAGRAGWLAEYRRAAMVSAIRRARHVVAASESTAALLRFSFGLDDSRLSVIYPMMADLDSATLEPDSSAGPPPAPPAPPYFLAVDTLEPRKNLLRVVEAHARTWPRLRIPLVLAGGYGWKQVHLLRRIEQSAGAVRWLGWVGERRLAQLYRGALAVIQFSLDEGFSYPAAEALAFGRPLALSDIPVHREIAGELGVYAAPDDAEALARRLEELADWDEARRASHALKARERALEIQRRAAVEHYLELYRCLAG